MLLRTAIIALIVLACQAAPAAAQVGCETPTQAFLNNCRQTTQPSWGFNYLDDLNNPPQRGYGSIYRDLTTPNQAWYNYWCSLGYWRYCQ
jgi:hypothetical protein